MATLSIGIGEMCVSSRPDDEIVALGLGSCVAIVLYDQCTTTVGAIHAMLPTRKGLRDSDGERPGRYVDEGLEKLFEMMRVRAGHGTRLACALVGGAAMFEFTGPSTLDIGKNNVKMSHELLKHFGIPILASDIGGNQGRSVMVAVGGAVVHVRTVGAQKPLVSLAQGNRARAAA